MTLKSDNRKSTLASAKTVASVLQKQESNKKRKLKDISGGTEDKTPPKTKKLEAFFAKQ
jgi:hypothetical protein